MPSIKPTVLLKTVPFSSLTTISFTFLCLLVILAFLSAIAKVRTPVVIRSDIGSAVRCFVLYSICSPIKLFDKLLSKSAEKNSRSIVLLSSFFGFLYEA